MKNNRKRTKVSLSAANIRVLGILCLMAGCVSTVIQKDILGVGQISNAQLLEVLTDSPDGMLYATAALLGQILEICAVPFFALLLSEGARHTSNYKRYFFQVVGLAFVCEIPYHLLTDGQMLVMGSLNPVFSAVLSLIVIYFFRAFHKKTPMHRVVKAMAILGAILWSAMLGVAFGGPCVILTAVFWETYGKGKMRILLGCGSALLCGVFSPLFIFSTTAFLAIYFYNGERGSVNKLVNYLAYPVILGAFWLASISLG